MGTALIQCEIYSKALMMQTSVSVIMPQDVKRNEKIKTLYLLHGYHGNHKDWIRYSSIERYVEDRRMAVIMPEVNNGYYANMENGLDYFTYVADELPHIMESMFPLSKKREDRYIAGLSMGGYGAFKIAAKRPQKFSKAISLSGSVNIITIRDISRKEDHKDYFSAVFGHDETSYKKHDLYHLFSKLVKLKNHPQFYMACGTEDFLYQDNEDFYNFLAEQGFDVYYETSSGAHTWAFWDDYIEKAISWLFDSTLI
ncbi:MAG: alpha/beta hydrolase family protein [Acholeplasmataceae bacterium]|nr:esterase family protein [Acholeplasmataceae bacterium]